MLHNFKGGFKNFCPRNEIYIEKCMFILEF